MKHTSKILLAFSVVLVTACEWPRDNPFDNLGDNPAPVDAALDQAKPPDQTLHDTKKTPGPDKSQNVDKKLTPVPDQDQAVDKKPPPIPDKGLMDAGLHLDKGPQFHDKTVADQAVPDLTIMADVQIVKAELIIDDFKATVVGQDVEYTVKVCNTGGPATAGFDVALRFDQKSAPGCATTADYKWALAGLAKNSCETRLHTRKNVPAGAYVSWVLVDACPATIRNPH